MRWIKSPAWDLLWVLNALWLAPLVLFLAWGHDEVRASPVDGLFFALTVPLWLGHRFSSAWLAYATPAYRPLLTTQRIRFIVAPVVIAVACFAVLLTPESVLPIPLAERVVWLAVVDFVLVSHHFAAQHFGLLSLYRIRAGRAAEPATRRLDRWFALVVGGGVVVLAEVLTGSIAFQERWVVPVLGAGWSAAVTGAVRDGGIGVVVGLTALMLAVELRSRRPSPPRMAYLLGLSAMVLVALLARDPFLFIVLWSVQHWTSAMGPTSPAASGGAGRRAGAGGGCWIRSTGAAGRCCWCSPSSPRCSSRRWRSRRCPTTTRMRIASSGPRRCGCGPHPSCRRCWRSASRPGLSITCSTAPPSGFPPPR